MTRKRALAAGMLVLLLLFFLSLRRRSGDTTSSSVSSTNGSMAVSLRDETTRTKKTPDGDTNGIANSVHSVDTVAIRLPQVLDGRIRTSIEADNVPINFWGQVLDQDGTPIEGATVSITVRHWQVTEANGIGSGSIPFDTETKTGGGFEVINASGDVLEVKHIVKEGYELSPRAVMGFNFLRGATGDPNNPVIYRMWKMRERQPLIAHHLSRVGIPCDGTPVTFDLLSGQKNPPEGDLRVTFIRSPVQLPPGTTNYAWTATFEMANGGLAEPSDDFMHLAPQSGYQATITVQMPKEASDWTSVLEKHFYFQARDGQYFGRLNVHLSTNYQPPPTGLSLDMVYNPSGSRSLE